MRRKKDEGRYGEVLQSVIHLSFQVGGSQHSSSGSVAIPGHSHSKSYSIDRYQYNTFFSYVC